MNRIYLDQASTSFPKAPGVAQAMVDYQTMNGVNVNRGCYSSAYSAEEVIYETRQLLAELFHFSKCKNVIFTPNVTTSLNFILKGFLKPGDHILVSAMEHNAVMRPVVQLASLGISFDRIPCRTDGSMILEKVEELQPLLMERADKKFLMKRVTEQDSENYKKRILIIGCGSIGGHVICELAKAGYEDLTIVDYEKLTEENIFRHVLGMEYVNRYKCEALNTYIQKNIPEVKITTLAERIEDAITEEDINFEDYNLIISAAGNHNLNRWINSWIQNNKIKVPVVYLWNEVYGIGNHAAYIKYGNCGCYECFFDRDEETGELYDKTSYCMRGQIITESAGGCGKTYVPYGNLVSLKTMLLCLKMVKNIFEENLDDNLLISLKGDSDYLEKHNLETSGRYLRQQEQIKILTGKQFVNINCGVCNDCNGK